MDPNAILNITTEVDGKRSAHRHKCEYRQLDGGFEIRYPDGAGETAVRFCETGLGGGKRAEIERSGEYSGLMTIEEERSCNCCMHTPHGRLDITVTGEKVGFGSRSGGKHAELVYTTSFAGGSSHISIRFNIKPQA